MNISVVHKEAFTVIGFCKKINKAFGETECPEFWNELFNKRFPGLLASKNPATETEKSIISNHIGMVALTIDDGISFDYVIGGEYKGGPVPEDLKLYPVAEHDWVCFENTGSMPDSLTGLYDFVWGQWFPSHAEYEIADTLDAGIFPSQDWSNPQYKSILCIPVRKIG